MSSAIFGDNSVRYGQAEVWIGSKGIVINSEPCCSTCGPEQISLSEAEDLILALRAAIDEKRRRDQEDWDSTRPTLQDMIRLEEERAIEMIRREQECRESGICGFEGIIPR
jgi:hypothetical protein